MTIAWQSNMETGASVVDAQHRALVERARVLVGRVGEGSGLPVVERALREFGDYAVRHFSQDEDCALRAACPALEWNAAARAELIGITASFRADYEKNGSTPAVAEALDGKLAEWVSRYIPGPEAAMRPCVIRECRR
jgi:hemerythrin-like metal-binding protein